MLNYNVRIFPDTGNSTGSSDIDLTEVWQIRMREVIYSCWDVTVSRWSSFHNHKPPLWQLSPPPPPPRGRIFSPVKVKTNKVIRAAVWLLHCVCRMKWQLWAAVSILLGLISMGGIHAILRNRGKGTAGNNKTYPWKSPRSRGGDIKETNCLVW